MRKIIFSILILCLFILPVQAQNIWNGNIAVGDSVNLDVWIANAAANAGTEYRLHIAKSISYIKNFTVGSNVTLVFTQDGYLTMTSVTMTVSGAIEAPYVQITDGTITYSSANDEYYNPVWVGSTGNLQYSQGQDATITTTVAGGATGAKIQISQATNALTGTLIGVRGNARVNTATTSSTGTVQGGKFQAGNMDAGYNLATVTGVYTEIVNKIPPDLGDSTVVWTNARGVEINMDLNQGSAGKTSTFTTAAGIYQVWNLPTAGTYTTVTNGYGIFLRNEQVGGNGQALDAALYVDDLNMGGGISGWDYGIDFSGMEANFGTADIRLADGALIENSTASLLTITEAIVDIDGASTATSYTSDADITATNDVIADSVRGTTGARFGGVTVADVTASNDVVADSIRGTTGMRTGGATVVDLTASNDVIADSVRGTTGIRAGGITDGTYTSNGSGVFTGVVALTSTLVTATGFNQQGIAVTNAATYQVLAANTGRVHIIGDFAQACTITLPTEAAGLNYEFWYYGAAAETHDDTLLTTGNSNAFKGNVVFLDTGDAISSVYSNGSTNSKMTLVNMNGGTRIKVFCDGTNWFITGSVVSDETPVFGDQ